MLAKQTEGKVLPLPLLGLQPKSRDLKIIKSPCIVAIKEVDDDDNDGHYISIISSIREILLASASCAPKSVRIVWGFTSKLFVIWCIHSMWQLAGQGLHNKRDFKSDPVRYALKKPLQQQPRKLRLGRQEEQWYPRPSSFQPIQRNNLNDPSHLQQVVREEDVNSKA